MNSYTAFFNFCGTLLDFLPKQKRNKQILYVFTGTPSVKDSIETIGIPHVEVDVILVNGVSVDFTFLLTDKDEVNVYPKTTDQQDKQVKHLIEPYSQKPQFILDVHLGTLARQLRMLGLDTLYERNFTDAQIAHLALTHPRIVLTRDILLLKRKSIKWGYWLRSQYTDKQLAEVMAYFELLEYIEPLSRCMACNGILNSVEKGEIVHLLQPQTNEYFQDFYQCSTCKKIYWKGSHYKKMVERIEQLKYKNQA